MEDLLNRFYLDLEHVETIHEIFSEVANYAPDEEIDFQFYKRNEQLLNESLRNKWRVKTS